MTGREREREIKIMFSSDRIVVRWRQGVVDGNEEDESVLSSKHLWRGVVWVLGPLIVF